MKAVQGTAADLRGLATAVGLTHSAIRDHVVSRGFNLLVAMEGGVPRGHAAYGILNGRMSVPYVVGDEADSVPSPTTCLLRAVRKRADEQGAFGPLVVRPYGEESTSCVLFTHGGIGQTGPEYIV